MKLHKIIQGCRNDVTLAESENDMDDHASCVSNPSTQTVSCNSSQLGKRSKGSSSQDGSTTKRKKPSEGKSEFVLPEFSEDIQRPFMQDAIFTTP